MRRILLLSLLALSLSANVAVGAMAIGKKRPWQRGPPAEPLLFSKVSLAPEQRARILSLRGELLAARGEQAERLAGMREALAALVTGDNVDPAAIDAKLEEIEARQAEYQRRVVTHVLAVRDLLHPDQRPAFRTLVTDHLRAGAPLDPTSAVVSQCGARR
jgi:nickel and cobalt resistance protein CnrR